ncbi:MAG: NAD(P)-dependent alcohol dehydrogenase [Spirochaetales bacterium]|nr:NAD(P)-dependent alcohol dehydrogenase [Spirochaetales bacterium]
MKALIYKKYGPPENLQFTDLDAPQPRDGEICIRVKAVSLNAYDWHMLTADIPVARLAAGFFRPKVPVLGADVSGTVEKTGNGAFGFVPGDRVFGDLSMSGTGGLSEYTAAPAARFHRIPDSLSYEEASALPMASVTAFQALYTNGKVQAGHKVLINGAAGGVGTFAIQIAKAFGARVTAVCSQRNHAQAQELGADAVIDYTRENFTENGEKYDIILGVNGYQPIRAYKNSLTPNGHYIAIGGTGAQIFQALLLGPLLSRKGGKHLGSMMATPKPEDTREILKLVEKKKLKPVIDKVFTFAQAVEAFRYLGSGHARGKIVITFP